MRKTNMTDKEKFWAEHKDPACSILLKFLWFGLPIFYMVLMMTYYYRWFVV